MCTGVHAMTAIACFTPRPKSMFFTPWLVSLSFVTSGRTAAVLTTHHINAVCRDTQGMLTLAPEHNQCNTTSADYAEIIHRVSFFFVCAVLG
jgi:hypothetical protein